MGKCIFQPTSNSRKEKNFSQFSVKYFWRIFKQSIVCFLQWKDIFLQSTSFYLYFLSKLKTKTINFISVTLVFSLSLSSTEAVKKELTFSITREPPPHVISQFPFGSIRKISSPKNIFSFSAKSNAAFKKRENPFKMTAPRMCSELGSR